MKGAGRYDGDNWIDQATPQYQIFQVGTPDGYGGVAGANFDSSGKFLGTYDNQGKQDPLDTAVTILTSLGFGAAAAGVSAAEGAAAGGAGALEAGGTGGLQGGLFDVGLSGNIPAGSGFGALNSGALPTVATYGGSSLGPIMDFGAAAAGGAAGASAAGGGGAAGGAVDAVGVPANPYYGVPGLPNLLKDYGVSGAMSSLGGSGGSGAFNWSSLIGPAISAIGGAYSANQAGKAADAQLQAAREAMAMFEPWRKAGEFGLNRLSTMLGRDGPEAAKAAFTTDPGYQFRVDEGMKALERAASPRGGLNSGKFYKDAMRFGQGIGSEEFGKSANRLLAISGMGQTATGSASDYLTQGANANAAGRIGRANAVTDAIGQGYSMYQNQQQNDRMNALMTRLLGSYA